MAQCTRCKGSGEMLWLEGQPRVRCGFCDGTGDAKNGLGCLFAPWRFFFTAVLAYVLADLAAWWLVGANVLGRIDPATQTIRGSWVLKEGKLLSGAEPASQIKLPVQPRSDYMIKMSVERKSGTGPLILGLISERAAFALDIDDKDQTISALQLLDGKPPAEQATKYAGTLLKVDASASILTCFVEGYLARSDLGVRLRSQWSELYQWSGPAAQVALAPEWTTSDPVVFLGAENSVFQITELRYVDTTWHAYATLALFVLINGLFFWAPTN
jgi:hypothetical protein